MMTDLKEFLHEFPTQGAASFGIFVLLMMTGVTVVTHMVLGHKMPDGYDGWFYFLAAGVGINMAGMGVKRATSVEFRSAKRPPNTEVNVETANVVNQANPANPRKPNAEPPVEEEGLG